MPFGGYFAFLVLIFAASAAATVVYVQVQTARDARREARAAAAFAANAASKQLGEQMALVKTTVAQLAANPSILQALARPKACSLNFAGPGGKADHLDIVRLDGVVVCSSRPRGPDGRLPGYRREAWVRAAARAPLFRGPIADKTTGGPVLVAAAPVAHKAVVAGVVDLTTLGPSLASVYGGRRQLEFLLVDTRSRSIVARSVEARRWIGKPVPPSASTDVDGVRRIYASAAVPGTRWRLYAGEDEARALAAGNRLRNRELAIALSSLALILLALLFVYRRAVVPMKRLSDAVRSTTKSGRFTPVDADGPTEVQTLANQINALTASVNAQAAVRKAREEAQRANEAKSRFLSHMSHELRTPLAAIMGFAELLRRRSPGEDEREWADQILRGGQHLLALVNELLEIARIDAGKITLALERVDVRATVEEVLSLSAPLAAARGIRLEAAVVETADAAVRADPVRLTQILLNLVSNAIKYNRDGGTVTITVAGTPRGTVNVMVRDTGPGIPADDLEKLFSPFERLDADQGAVAGTGLGLVVTKGLVEAMEGRLEVDSVPGTGTTFTVELPDADALDAGRAPAPARDGAAAGSVLYIEDNLVNLQIVDGILADLRPQLEVRTATTGEEGAALAAERRPNLLLLDLNLPDMAGEEVLRRLRAHEETADVPVLIVSADSTSRNVTRLLGTGADAYLTKPLDVPQFLETVDRLLATR